MLSFFKESKSIESIGTDKQLHPSSRQAMDILHDVKSIIESSKKHWSDIASEIGVSAADIERIKLKENPLEEFIINSTMKMWDDIFQYVRISTDRSIIKNISKLGNIFNGEENREDNIMVEDVDIIDHVARRVKDWKQFASVLNFDQEFINELQKSNRTYKDRNKKMMKEFAETDHLKVDERWRFWRVYLEQFEEGKHVISEIESCHHHLYQTGYSLSNQQCEASEKHTLIRGSNFYGKQCLMLEKYKEVVKNMDIQNDVIYLIHFDGTSEVVQHVKCLKSPQKKPNTHLFCSEDFVRSMPDGTKPSLTMILQHIQKIWNSKRVHVFIDQFDGSNLNKKEVLKLCNILNTFENIHMVISTCAKGHSKVQPAKESGCGYQFDLLEEQSLFSLYNIDHKMQCSLATNKFVDVTSKIITSQVISHEDMNCGEKENARNNDLVGNRSIQDRNLIKTFLVNFYYFDKYISDEPENASPIYFSTIDYILSVAGNKRYVICTYDRELYNDMYQYLWNHSTYDWTSKLDEYIKPSSTFNLLLTDDISSQGYGFDNVIVMLRFHDKVLKYRMMECLSKAKKKLHIISDNVEFVDDVVHEPHVSQTQSYWSSLWNIPKTVLRFAQWQSSNDSNDHKQQLEAGENDVHPIESVLISTWKKLDCVNFIQCMYNRSEDLFQLFKDDVVLYSKNNLNEIEIQKICLYPWNEESENFEREVFEEEGGNLLSNDSIEIDFSRAIHLIMQSNSVSLLQVFVNVNSIDITTYCYQSDTLLHIAAQYGASDIIDYFIKNSLVYVNCTNDAGITPLHTAAANEKVEAIEMLINNHADVNVKDIDGWTPLHFAAKNDAVSSIETLINNHADVNAKDKDGWTPLHFAAKHDAVSSIEILINNHADVNAKINFGSTPLHVAAAYDKVSCIEILINHLADVNAKDEKGSAPLHCAVQNNAVSSIETLIRSHADVNAKGYGGFTPLHIAAQHDLVSSIEILINNNADVHAKNKWEETPLHVAAQTDAVSLIETLINNNADVNAKTNRGQSVMDLVKNNAKATATIKTYLEVK